MSSHTLQGYVITYPLGMILILHDYDLIPLNHVHISLLSPQ